MSLAEGWAWSTWPVFNPISVRSFVVVIFRSFSGHIGQTTGCPTSQRIVYMGVAADCEYTSKYGSTSNATQAIITNWNTASALYKVSGIQTVLRARADPHSVNFPSQPWYRRASSTRANVRFAPTRLRSSSANIFVITTTDVLHPQLRMHLGTSLARRPSPSTTGSPFSRAGVGRRVTMVPASGT